MNEFAKIQSLSTRQRPTVGALYLKSKGEGTMVELTAESAAVKRIRGVSTGC